MVLDDLVAAVDPTGQRRDCRADRLHARPDDRQRVLSAPRRHDLPRRVGDAHAPVVRLEEVPGGQGPLLGRRGEEPVSDALAEAHHARCRIRIAVAASLVQPS
jgi:hypothetical protein